MNWTEIIENALTDGDRDPDTSNKFRSHYAGNCKRQIYLSKLDLKEVPLQGKIAMRIGSEIHSWLEEDVEFPDGYHSEMSYTQSYQGLILTGKADVVTPDEVVDFKTRKGFHYMDSAKDGYHPQVNLYMWAFNKNKGRLVYINKIPDENTIKNVVREQVLQYDQKKFEETLDKYREVLEAIKDEPDPQEPSDIPFDKCGCWLCGQEILRI